MNKKIVASLAMLIPLMFSQAVFADNKQVVTQDSKQQLAQELTKEDLLAATQDYVLEEVERPQARRSALFAHILDTMAQNATMAKVEKVSLTLKS